MHDHIYMNSFIWSRIHATAHGLSFLNVSSTLKNNAQILLINSFDGFLSFQNVMDETVRYAMHPPNSVHKNVPSARQYSQPHTSLAILSHLSAISK